ncbi:autophagy-related protein 18g-like isoform X2 [Malania oleifera]|nr:autophagy-related protein 18g-like isoform X2 [Malania oleifera]
MKKGRERNNGLLPNYLNVITSCIKTVSSNAGSVASTVRSAGASVAASVSAASEDNRDKVTWAGFDKLELGPSAFKHVLLLGYQNGFQVLDVEEASNFSELVSKRDGPVTFLQMQPIPTSDGHEGFRASHPLLLVVAGDEPNSLNLGQDRSHLDWLGRDNLDSHSANCVNSPTAVQFYSLRSHCYVHVLRFRSAVCMVRCSPRIVAVSLATQIYCFDALTLENKFSILTYPVPQLGGQGTLGVNIGYGPMALGPRWLAYASNNPLPLSTGRLSPQNLTPPGVSPSTSPGGSSFVARYALESSKQLAAGIINLGDMGYKTLSKYCQDLLPLPDGSNSPVSPSSSWKVGRFAATETDNVGMVVIKDFASQAVISQFKAHTTPISALCFDPSGTLLVTASVYGNSINIFRIMPPCAHSRSGTQNNDWSSSHVHLYKLHRGIRTAIIQDICFSYYSQWIAIVSSKGTCHVFVLSPFGGDAGFQTLSSQVEEPNIFPVLSLPWWSTSSGIMNQQYFRPPPPVTLPVVSRIKDSNSGWLNTVNNAASVMGKVFIPSGAVASVFHNSISSTFQEHNSRINSLEHLLVYTPSGHVVQHELLPSLELKMSDGGSRTCSGSFVQIQDEELKVRVEPLQWWDVCRRSDWPEREDCLLGATLGTQEAAVIVPDRSGHEDNYSTNNDTGVKDSVKTDTLKLQEQSHGYLSNAEVQISRAQFPMWQKSKICFYMMAFPRVDDFAGGEFEIENVPVQELELKQKDLLPVFDHFPAIRSSWNDRGLTVGRYSNPSLSGPYQTKERVTEETVICHLKSASLGSTESLDGGSSRTIGTLLDMDQVNIEKLYMSTCQTLNECCHKRRETLADKFPASNQKTSSILPTNEYARKAGSHVDKNHTVNALSSIGSDLASVRQIAVEGLLVKTGVIGDVPPLSADTMNICAKKPTPSNMQSSVNFGQFCQEGYCKMLEVDRDLINDDVDSCSSHCEGEKPEENEEDDEMLGGIFAFSEEG